MKTLVKLFWLIVKLRYSKKVKMWLLISDGNNHKYYIDGKYPEIHPGDSYFDATIHDDEESNIILDKKGNVERIERPKGG